jgi:hypothetical protein
MSNDIIDQKKDTEELLNKYINNIKIGKEIYENDKEKSIKYFKDNLDIVNILKKDNNIDVNFLEKTETECLKYLNLTIDTSIESEYNEVKLIEIRKLVKSIQYGNLEEIKKLKYGQIDFKKFINFRSASAEKKETILHYALRFGDTGFLKHAFFIGSKIDLTDSEGHSLLEFACLQQDPNMINFLIKYGAHLQKHLYFREGNIKFNNQCQYIDIAILIKLLIINNNSENKHNYVEKIKNYVNLEDLIGLDNFKMKDLLKYLNNFLNTISSESSNTYISIIEEEVSFSLQNKLGCPTNKLEIILTNLVPFINYSFNLSIDWIISLELKYLLMKLIKKKKFNAINIKKELLEEIWEIYIKNKLFKEDYIGILISQWIAKIKV